MLFTNHHSKETLVGFLIIQNLGYSHEKEDPHTNVEKGEGDLFNRVVYVILQGYTTNV